MSNARTAPYGVIKWRRMRLAVHTSISAYGKKDNLPTDKQTNKQTNKTTNLMQLSHS
jgi:hypothetical protein